VTSIFWWENKLDKADEWVVFLKTKSEAYPGLEAAIREIHPYDVPEIIVVPIQGGNTDYLHWLEEEIGDGAVTSDK
jgi:periplasmic divalent cation tolerance protein